MLPSHDRYRYSGIGSRAIVGKLNAGTNSILEQRAVQERLAVLAFDYTPNTRQQFAEDVQREVVKWGKVVKDSGAATCHCRSRTIQ